MYFAAFAFLPAVITGAGAAFRRRLDGATVENAGRRLFIASFGEPRARRAGRGRVIQRPRLSSSAGIAGRRHTRVASRGASIAIRAPVRMIQRKPLKTSRRG